jgi:hypothetical protein
VGIPADADIHTWTRSDPWSRVIRIRGSLYPQVFPRVYLRVTCVDPHPCSALVEANQLRLTEVLYSPEVGYTLVSIGRLDDMGFTATFGGGKCVLRGPDGARVGVVPKNSKGLYRVEHEPDSVNAVGEKISLAAMSAIFLYQSG